jgi:hypothetical protein
MGIKVMRSLTAEILKRIVKSYKKGYKVKDIAATIPTPAE